MRVFDVAIVGSGFAGSILARILNRIGRSVVLLEKGRHPRFALGESSTPLASLCLERLARRYDLPDLVEMAAYGRWMEHRPDLRRGLKRGFTFYAHTPGEPYQPGENNERRLLVAASPDDASADTHWLREDVDHHLARAAMEEGVTLYEGFTVGHVTRDASSWELRRSNDVSEATEATEAPAVVRARFVVDASGAAGVVAEALGIGLADEPARFRSSLVYSHLAWDTVASSATQPSAQSSARTSENPPGMRSFSEGLEPGPYPDGRAAVHHLLDEGWVYVLPFDHGCSSVGLVRIGGHEPDEAKEPEGPPEAAWQTVMSRYPSLVEAFSSAHVSRPWDIIERMQYRRLRAAGDPDWALLPHSYAFFDPMFSTGIAWSLLAVERLARVLDAEEDEARRHRLAAYDRLLSLEADQIERLIYGTYLARHDFDLFAHQSFLYFAAVSFEELSQRLLEPITEDDAEGEFDGAAWTGFLGAGSGWPSVFEEAVARLRGIQRAGAAGGDAAVRDSLADAFKRWVERVIAPRNLIGLADPQRHNLYPIDLDLLVERAGLLNLSREELIARLPRLRG